MATVGLETLTAVTSLASTDIFYVVVDPAGTPLGRKITYGNLGFAATTHTHAASAIVSGTIDIARIPTGTTGTTVSLGNHTHAAADIVSGTIAIARIPTGTTGTTVALGNHTHLVADITDFDPADKANVAGGNTLTGTQDIETITNAGINAGATGVGFYGTAEQAQPAAIADATDAASAITQLNDLLAAMRTLGLIAT